MTPAIPFICASGYAFAEPWRAALQAAMPLERIVALESLDKPARAACDFAIVANPDTRDLATLPQLKWVHSVWAGVERLVEDLQHSPVEIVRLVDPQLAETMAEAVLAWTLYLHRDMPRYARQQAAGQWLEHDYVRPQEKTVALLGLGELGLASAARLLAAGFQVSGWSRSRKAVPGVQCFAGDEELPALLAGADILVFQNAIDVTALYHFDEASHQPAISLVRADGSLRYFNGYVTAFRFVRTDGGFAFYEMLLEPWLAFTRLRKDSVSFHGKSVREITEETLQHFRQADWHMHTFEEDPRLTVANQHNETDWNHLHRRWEALGCRVFVVEAGQRRGP